jgi:tRNA 2-selenouridine synthase
MAVRFETLGAILAHGWDSVIDVRSPAEFAEDHVPGAVNLPAMSNDERARVGTLYKQVSPFDARKIGAAIVARNVAAHLEGPLAARDGGWRPLVYCWRGGQRSGSVATILTQVGWRTETIAGGYQSFRRLVHAAVYEAPFPARIVLIDGNTGTAKTAVLARLAARGHQVIDLEAMAGHRGSLLGATEAGQPSQRAFETRIAVALAGLDPARPVAVEAESSKIGRLIVPPSLWAAMCAAPRIDLVAPVEARAAYLVEAYADVIADPARLADLLQPLRHHRGHGVVDGWLALLAQGAHRALAAALITDHYDPAYARSRAAHRPAVIGQAAAGRLDAAGIDALAAQAEAMLRAI